MGFDEQLDIAKRMIALTVAVYMDEEEMTPLAIQMLALAGLKSVFSRKEFTTTAELEELVSMAYEQLRGEKTLAA